MSTQFYIKDENGIFLSVDGKIKYTCLEGQKLYNFLKTKDGRKRCFHVEIDEDGNKIGIEGRTECAGDRVREDAVMSAFIRMSDKLAQNREELLGDLIRQLEKLQSRTSGSGEQVYQLNRQIADVNAQSLVVAQLYKNGILNHAEYASRSGELDRKVSELRSERRRILTEDEDDEIIESLKELNDTIAEYVPTDSFDTDLFGQIVESITVIGRNTLRFRLAGGLTLTEKFEERSA